MAGFDHGPVHPQEVEDEAEIARRGRIGLQLFAVYCVAYGAFMVVNAFAPEVMEMTIGGVNLALWSGFGLIGGAIVLGTVSGLIIAASGAIAHDICSTLLKMEMNDAHKIRIAKIASVAVGVIAIVLGILFEKMNVSYSN